MIAVASLLLGCGGTGSDTSTLSNNTESVTEVTSGNSGSVDITSAEDIKTIHITDDIQIKSLGVAKNIHSKITLGSVPKDIFLLLSNYGKSSGSVTVRHNAKRINRSYSETYFKRDSYDLARILHRPPYIDRFSRKVASLLTRESDPLARRMKATKRAKYSVDSFHTFSLDDTGNQITRATLRKVIADINTSFGLKSLNIWVSDDSFGSNCGKAKCVTQPMVDELASRFLQSGADNDIYDWVTNIYGEEWGKDATNKYPALITPTDEITILLTDIDDDNRTDGGVIGFFWSKDNFVKSSNITGSNEMIMFYIDALLFANLTPTDTAWRVDNFWPKEVISTLTHEFQHMIHFYQKEILRLPKSGQNTDVWINEMLSETTEDIVATKIHYDGPRGVVYTDGSAGSPNNTKGRYPIFNQFNRASLTQWNNQLSDYSKVNAFGAYLIRNYGGAKLLHDIMYNKFTDEKAIEYAVHQSPNGVDKTFHDLIREWGIAVLLSDHTNLINMPTYNAGDFTLDTYNGSTYELGSINFFNYHPTPTIFQTSGDIASDGNYYYRVGSGVTGDIDIDIELNGETEATLIVK